MFLCWTGKPRLPGAVRVCRCATGFAPLGRCADPSADWHGDPPLRRGRRYFRWSSAGNGAPALPLSPGAPPSVRTGCHLPPSARTAPCAPRPGLRRGFLESPHHPSSPQPLSGSRSVPAGASAGGSPGRESWDMGNPGICRGIAFCRPSKNVGSRETPVTPQQAGARPRR